ncbi:hypothetical protein V494_04829 [Pseudogymnoascus sp. VKM F-4513 (FW-928)]|nr:hypothetical protein V494_04829 [Pseudogymnoascus sp. VKM F-4513 (FW-928)]
MEGGERKDASNSGTDSPTDSPTDSDHDSQKPSWSERVKRRRRRAQRWRERKVDENAMPPGMVAGPEGGSDKPWGRRAIWRRGRNEKEGEGEGEEPKKKIGGFVTMLDASPAPIRLPSYEKVAKRGEERKESKGKEEEREEKGKEKGEEEEEEEDEMYEGDEEDEWDEDSLIRLSDWWRQMLGKGKDPTWQELDMMSEFLTDLLDEETPSLEMILTTRLHKLLEALIKAAQEQGLRYEGKRYRKVAHKATEIRDKWMHDMGGELYNMRAERRKMLKDEKGRLARVHMRPAGAHSSRWVVEGHCVEEGVEFEPGMWWLNDACAERDGMLTDTRGNVSVSPQSIPVVTLAFGEELPTKKPAITRFTHSGRIDSMMVPLIRALDKRVQVLRRYTLKSRLAPEAGLRYDGFYDIVTYSLKRLSWDESIFRVVIEFERCMGQRPMDTVLAVPTPSMLDDWEIYQEVKDDSVRRSIGEAWYRESVSKEKEEERDRLSWHQVRADEDERRAAEDRRRDKEQQRRVAEDARRAVEDEKREAQMKKAERELKYLEEQEKMGAEPAGTLTREVNSRRNMGHAAGAANGGDEEHARKRVRLEDGVSTTATPSIDSSGAHSIVKENMEKSKIAELTSNASHSREREVGILRWVNEKNVGFEGVLKQRYTDFLVNEITPDGKVIHLTNLYPPKQNKQQQPKPAEPPAPQEPVKAAETVESVSVPATTVATEAAQPPAPTAADSAKPPTATPSSAAATADSFALTPEDEVLLDNYFGADVREQIVKMYKKILAKPNEKAATYGSVTSEPILDRALRTKLHQDMRRIFDSRLETNTDKDGLIRISAAPKAATNRGARGAPNQQTPRNQQKGKLGWAELGGEHLHFSLLKENKDTMEVISFISSRLGMKPRSFAFAGTKDRRGVTVQRVSVFRKNAEQIVHLNRDMWGSKIGDFTYEKHALELGDLTGNEFHITLRDCQFPGADSLDDEGKLALANRVVGGAVESIQSHGFLNYYGLQRFGTYLIGTDEIGKLILKNDYKGAVDALLTFSPECLSAGQDPDFVTSDGKPLSRDDIARAKAIDIFKTTGRAKEALDKLPRKFSAESTIIRHLERGDRKTDYVGAILQINRNLRLMYVHAYQSLVWNHAVSERWARFGDKVVEGDLVLVEANADKPAVEELDQNGEVVVLPAADDTAVSTDDMFQRARPLSAEEAASGKFTIFDIVLPTPGYDIEYPMNAIGDFYKTFMSSERGGGLDPANMRRPQKDFSLSGSYRKIMGTVGNDVTYEVKAYTEDNEQMVETDLDRINKSRGQPNRNAEPKHKYAGKEVFGNADAVAGRNAWAESAKTIAEGDKALEATAVSGAGDKTSAPAVHETFIQRDTGNGEQTGVKETVILGGPAAPVASDATMNEAPAAATVVEATADKKRTAEDMAVHDDEVVEKRRKIAVVVKFQLGSSQYATMALRELMKEGGVVTYKPDFSGGR